MGVDSHGGNQRFPISICVLIFTKKGTIYGYFFAAVPGGSLGTDHIHMHLNFSCSVFGMVGHGYFTEDIKKI